MNKFEKKLKKYISDNTISAKHLSFKQSVHSVAQAAEAVAASPEDFIKSICMIDAEGRLIVAIVNGLNRASTKRVGKAINIDRPRLATAQEMIELTGYESGGIPAFGFDAVFLVDPKVEEMEKLYTGGGSENSLAEMSAEEFLKANGGRVVRVRK